MRVLLIAGGWSSEREISLLGARGIADALRSLGHDVTFFDLLFRFDELLATARQHDVALINLHGQPGEDGIVQAMLDLVGCPYQGTGPSGSFLALNKAVTKQILKDAGLPTPAWEFLPQRPGDVWKPRIAFPVFVKSNTGGSSLHLGKAVNQVELNAILDEIFEAGDAALIEEALCGREITCGVLGDEALPPIQIEPVRGEYFNFESKYAKDGAREICPAPLDGKLTAKVQQLALAAHRALGLEGVSRSDFILGPDGNLNFLEVNTLPGMTPTSLVPKEAMAIGLDFKALVAKLIDLALKKRSRSHQK